MSQPVRRSGLVLAILAVAAGCSDVVAPRQSNVEVIQARVQLFSDAQQVNVLKRTSPLAADLTASAEVGAAGGTIEIPGAGVTVVFPAGAVQAPLGETVQISVTALAGDAVAYDFQPHGIQFAVPVHVLQNLSGTRAAHDPLSVGAGAYFPDASSLNPLAGTVQVTELRPTFVNLVTGTVDFSIAHFSGYTLSGNKDGGTPGDSTATNP